LEAFWNAIEIQFQAPCILSIIYIDKKEQGMWREYLMP
jgi:hypothetical protein